MINKITLLLSLLILQQAYSQDVVPVPTDTAKTNTTAAPEEVDLMQMMDSESKASEPIKVKSTFKGTQIINGPSVELIGPGMLQFMFQHRFGTVENGSYDLWGMDEANIRLSLDYGITPWLNVGIGRSNVQKVYDANVKARVITQQKSGSPITMDLYGVFNYNTLHWNDPILDDQTNRIAYSANLLIARKFSDRFSVQISPTFVHRNIVNYDAKNDVISVGIAARYKFSKRMAVMGEYFYVPDNQNTANYVPVASIGLDIETGGHVFQLHFTNASTMNEYLYLTENTSKWSEYQFRLGFNISRIFTVNSKASQREW